MAIGRPKADIDWDKADQLLISGCSGIEIAGYFGLNPATIYERCVLDKGMTFSEYSSSKYAKGDTFLRDKQYEIAMQGDKTMLVWLGKNRLKQKEGDDRVTNNFYFKEIDPTDDSKPNRNPVQIQVQTISERDMEGSEEGL